MQPENSRTEAGDGVECRTWVRRVQVELDGDERDAAMA